MHETDDTDPYAGTVTEPCWRCQSCGHKDTKKPLPKDRGKYYSDPKPRKCPRCKSLDMAPEGF